MDFHQWQVIFADFGRCWDLLPEGEYSKEELKEGVNVGREFSDPHMAIVLSPNPLCKGDTILVVPITKYTEGDERHWDKIVLEPEENNFLRKKSAIHLSAIRAISKQRVRKEIRPYISKKIQRQIRDRLCSFFRIK